MKKFRYTLQFLQLSSCPIESGSRFPLEGAHLVGRKPTGSRCPFRAAVSCRLWPIEESAASFLSSTVTETAGTGTEDVFFAGNRVCRCPPPESLQIPSIQVNWSLERSHYVCMEGRRAHSTPVYVESPIVRRLIFYCSGEWESYVQNGVFANWASPVKPTPLTRPALWPRRSICHRRTLIPHLV
jgi:hypothetical protein